MSQATTVGIEFPSYTRIRMLEAVARQQRKAGDSAAAAATKAEISRVRAELNRRLRGRLEGE